jgi:serine/tyrosine/threonine adenylyltransferase
MERLRVHHVCNASDTDGRYAYEAQPAIGQWNCARLIDACAALLAPGDAAPLHAVFAPAYQRAVMRRWCAKLGLASMRDGDAALVNRLLTLMQHGRCDFTLTFRALSDAPATLLRERFIDRTGFDAWWADWQARLQQDGAPEATWRARMRRTNPAFVLRNHLAQAAIDAATQGDVSELRGLLKVLQHPFDDAAAGVRYAAPAPASAPAIEVSCSS